MDTKLNIFEEGDVVRLSRKKLSFISSEIDVNSLYIVDYVFKNKGWGYIIRTYYPINVGGEDPIQYDYFIVEDGGIEGATLEEYLNYERGT